jgi:hypothetical protein
MAAFLGQFTGGLVISLIIIGVLNKLLRRWLHGEPARLFISFLGALAVVTVIGGYGLADDKSEPLFLPALAMYLGPASLAGFLIALGAMRSASKTTSASRN